MLRVGYTGLKSVFLREMSMSMKRLPLWLLGIFFLVIGITGCDDSETYAEQLAMEKSSIKAFMKSRGYTVTNTYPDTVPFPEGVFYKTSEGLYIHVLDTGLSVPSYIAKNTSYLIRFVEVTMDGDTLYQNMFDATGDPLEIYYDNIQTTISYGDCKAWHQPLKYVGDGGHVYIIAPTALGMPVYSSTTTSLTPCFYELRYTLWR